MSLQQVHLWTHSHQDDEAAFGLAFGLANCPLCKIHSPRQKQPLSPLSKAESKESADQYPIEKTEWSDHLPIEQTVATSPPRCLQQKHQAKALYHLPIHLVHDCIGHLEITDAAIITSY